MKLAQFEHGNYVCGHGYSYQASWKEEYIEGEVGKVPAFTPRSPGDIRPQFSVCFLV